MESADGRAQRPAPTKAMRAAGPHEERQTVLFRMNYCYFLLASEPEFQQEMRLAHVGAGLCARPSLLTICFAYRWPNFTRFGSGRNCPALLGVGKIDGMI